MRDESDVLFFDYLEANLHVCFEHIGIHRFQDIRPNTPRNELTIFGYIDHDLVHFCGCISIGESKLTSVRLVSGGSELTRVDVAPSTAVSCFEMRREKETKV